MLTNFETKMLLADEKMFFFLWKQSINKIVHERNIAEKPETATNRRSISYYLVHCFVYHNEIVRKTVALSFLRKLWLGRRIFEQSAKRKITHKLSITARIHVCVSVGLSMYAHHKRSITTSANQNIPASSVFSDYLINVFNGRTCICVIDVNVMEFSTVTLPPFFGQS